MPSSSPFLGAEVCLSFPIHDVQSHCLSRSPLTFLFRICKSFVIPKLDCVPLTFRRLDKFLPHAAEFGFFLHIPTFRANALLSLPFGHHQRPSPALLSAVYLWGVHLGQSEALLLEENAFLIRAVQHTATDLLSTHPSRVLHTLQAQVLLAYYFFRTGRFLEAKCQTGAAISLALGAGFHKLRSTNIWPPTILGLTHDTPLYLDAPQSNLEEGERINAFWAVFVLHKIITVALEPPANVCGALEAPGILIDTPWPLETKAYADVRLRCLGFIASLLTRVLTLRELPPRSRAQQSGHS